MSLYNLVNGVNPATFYFLPMLGKHPDEYPRFRDCYIGNDDERPEINGKIVILTRTGGGNREDYEEENDEITNMPTYLFDFDDDFDSTFAHFVHDVPAEWQADFNAVLSGDPTTISDAYLARLKEVFPKLADQFQERLRPVAA